MYSKHTGRDFGPEGVPPVAEENLKAKEIIHLGVIVLLFSHRNMIKIYIYQYMYQLFNRLTMDIPEFYLTADEAIQFNSFRFK